jgi:hemerythrin-like domain-containing protein
MTTPETTTNSSPRGREHANIPPERRDHRGSTAGTSGSGVDTHEMVLIHRVIRREIGQLPRLFRSAANDRARSKIIGVHARQMLDFLHTHHTGEDLLLFPLLRERRVLDPELMDRMDAQHAQVNDAVVAINAELPAWTASADAAAGERMAAVIDETMPTLIGHLDEEEQKLLPIVSVTLTQSEWNALAKHSVTAIPVTRRLLTLGYITEEADDEERQTFMQVLPAPARLAYKLIGQRQFTRETTTIRG